ncbi:MAG: hypothetical protein KDA24_10935 [Deltaproteobacteria bacterium]|nr:hypothetical protein [Deltaproteobacteria bacterium]
MGRVLSERLSGGLFGGTALLALLVGGCLSSVPTDDDDSAHDDDGSNDDDLANDDDSSDDDDATDDDDTPVDQAANGAVILMRFSGVDVGATSAAAFASEPIEPSAEEAAWEETTPLVLPTLAPPDGFRQLEPNSYTGPYSLDADGLFAVLDGQSIALPAEAPGLYGVEELGASQVPVGQSFTAQITGDGPLAGFHEGPEVPRLPELSGPRLLGHTLFLMPGVGVELQTEPSPGAEIDVFSLGGLDGPARAWANEDGLLEIPAGEVPPLGNESFFFYQRTNRSRAELDGGSLLLVAGHWVIGRAVPMGTGDVFLRPIDPEPGDLAPGQLLRFEPAPALQNPGPSFVVAIDGVEHTATSDAGEVQVVIDDPSALGWGWVDVEMDVPGGQGRGAIRLGPPVPSCDLQEFGSNDALGGANAFAAGQVLCGSFESPGDSDWSRFEATAGATYELQVFSRRIGSLGSPGLTVWNADGLELAVATEAAAGDVRLQWTASSTGPIFLRADEVAGEGGPGFDWRLQVRPDPTR